ncbi:MAG: beta-ketoacyl-ACP synthase II [Paludibacteraceae bacterium]|nr:beta-ketoacyl-ACP synthase II [Paludibacteraceae bacterium]
MELKRVVVTGLGAVTPLGNDVDTTWTNLVNGVSGAATIKKFDASNFRTQFGCEVKNFDPNEYFDRKDARKYDLFTQYALVAADQAVKDCGMDLDTVNHDRIGVIWGAGIGGMTTIQEAVTEYATGDGTPRFNPFFIPKLIADIAAGHISIRYGFRGPNYATVAACASSNVAIADAFNYIRLGKSDAIVTGGSEAALCESGLGGFVSMKALSTRNESPETASRPFSKSRDGFVMGEGGVCLILEEYEHAKKRGAKIYAEVVGAGLTADAHHMTAPHPEGLGAANVMREAIEDAGIKPDDIDYVNVHGTSTPLGDIAEVKAIQSVFGEHAFDINISSTKSMTGHMLGAAGAMEALASVLALKNGIVPPTINHADDDVDENFDPRLNFTFNKAQKREIKYALSNTFGFGGHNASVIFKKA